VRLGLPYCCSFDSTARYDCIKLSHTCFFGIAAAVSAPEQCSIVADALRKKKLAFGFSAGGLLFPYYIGVIEQLEDLGVLTGASGSCVTHPHQSVGVCLRCSVAAGSNNSKWASQKMQARSSLSASKFDG